MRNDLRYIRLKTIWVRFGLSLAVTFAVSVSVADKTEENQSDLVPQGLIQLGNGHYFSPYALVVDKKERKLTVWKQEGDSLSKVGEFPSDMGKNGGDKGKEGDHKTPEGIYFLEKMIEGSTLPYELYGLRAFTTNYPNIFDQRMGKTGSGIWLHAIPDTISLERGSRGCVVVRNTVILEVSKFITPEKTPILIYDSVNYGPKENRKTKLKSAEKFLATWLETWKSKNLSNYMSFYSKTFKSNNMNYQQWEKYKSGLATEYGKIEIELFSPVIYEHKKGWVVRSLQAYKSDKYEDFGEKILYLQEEDQQLKIIAEEWRPAQKPGDIQSFARCCTTASYEAKN